MSTLRNDKMTNYRWIICAMLFFATTVNYMDRQVLSLTWKDFIAPEFHWTDSNYGDITAIFSIVYAIANLFAGRFIDWMGTKKGYLWAIGVWSLGACAHALCGWATEHTVGIHTTTEMLSAGGAVRRRQGAGLARCLGAHGPGPHPRGRAGAAAALPRRA